MNRLLLYSFLGFAVSASLLTARDASYACNNSPDLCGRAYSDVAQLGAHDSPFITNGSSNSNSLISFTDVGNQNVNSTAQLAAGVRLLSAQIHNSDGEWHLCHTSCSLLDAGTLSSWLAEIKLWLDANSFEVVTILLVNSDNASVAQLHEQFKNANLTSYAYVPPSTAMVSTPWPTLKEMISNNSRLVTFVASLTTANTVAPYLLNEFTFIFETPYNVTSRSDFSCAADRPASVQGETVKAISSGRLSLVNHFLDRNAGLGIQIPDVNNINATNGVNGIGSLGEASSMCTAAYSKPPNFFLVDYFDRGAALEVVDGLNKITATGRGEMPEMSSAQPNSSASPGAPTLNLSHTNGAIGTIFLFCLIIGTASSLW